MAKDKKKSKAAAAEKKQRIADKAERKAAKKDKKLFKLTADDSDDDGEFEAVLAAFQQRQVDEVRVDEVAACPPPTRRANASLTVNPLNPAEVFLFGGEYFNGKYCEFYNDLYVFNAEKDAWTKYESTNCPGPRSSHQMVATGTGQLFMFSGEFASKNESQFYHWKDMWMLDAKSRSWEKLEFRVMPSARSGHRMTMWKHFIILFGGFHDNARLTKYYDDLWAFDTRELRWHKLDIPDTAGSRPSARSGCSLFSDGKECVYLHGGFTKIVTKGDKAKGVIHSDLWALKLNADLDPKLMKWERRKKAGYYPSPRAGAPTTVWKDKAFMFGGVFDTDPAAAAANPGLPPTICYGDAYTMSLDNGRWHSVALRGRKKTAGEKRAAAAAAAAGEAVPNDTAVAPRPRFNAMLAIGRNMLFLYGGITDVQGNEQTLGDFYTLALDKLDVWQCKIDSELGEWVEDNSDDDDDDDEDDDEEEEPYAESDEDEYGVASDDGEWEEEVDGQQADNGAGGAAEDDDPDALLPAKRKSKKKRSESDGSHVVATPVEDAPPAAAETTEPEPVVVEDIRVPMLRESLRDFYARNTEFWMGRAADELQGVGSKDLKRRAFELAKVQFEEYQSVLAAMEDMDLDFDGANHGNGKKGGGLSGPPAAGAASRHRR